MPAETILLVDDDASALDLERMYLEREGFRIFSVKTGFDALNSSQTIHPDAMVMSLVLPGMDGFEVCRRLRGENNQVPILAIFSSEKELNSNSIKDFEADDYLAKPFNPREMVARVKAILHQGRMLSQRSIAALEIGNVKIDMQKHSIVVDGKPLALRKLEYELLLLLMREPGKFLSAEYLMREGWGIDFSGQTKSVGLHIARLQSRLTGTGLTIQSDPQTGFALQA